jgi:hypothetical protein
MKMKDSSEPPKDVSRLLTSLAAPMRLVTIILPDRALYFDSRSARGRCTSN